MNTNAYSGMNHETLFQNSIGDYPSIIESIRTKYNIQGHYNESFKTGIHGEKSDVKIAFSCGYNIDVNIKSYKESVAFNQITRTTLAKFCDMFSISPEDQKELEFLITAKAGNVKTLLFPIEKQQKWKAFFEEKSKEILKWGFSYKPSREVLVLYDSSNYIFRIYSMIDVLSKLKRNVSFSRNGNVDIGDCVSFQRKGGNGSLSKNIQKTSIKHPGNNIQLKLKALKFVELMDAAKIGQYKLS